MTTQCAIIARCGNGYAGIYLHQDGRPESAGDILLEHYKDPDKVAALLALGDLSILGPSLDCPPGHSFDTKVPGHCVAYARDNNEAFQPPARAATVEKVCRALGLKDLVYVYEQGKWTFNGQPPVDGRFGGEALQMVPAPDTFGLEPG